jgi:hypothetical protein
MSIAVQTGLSIAETALRYMGVLGGLGLAAGVVSGLIKAHGAKTRRTYAHRNVPREVAESEQLMDLYITMASHKGADTHLLNKAFNRCAAMVSVYDRIAKASPGSVKPSLITDARKIYTAFSGYLQEFYRESRISLIQMGSTTVPVNGDLQAAHNALMAAVHGNMASITNLIQRKMHQAVALRV